MCKSLGLFYITLNPVVFFPPPQEITTRHLWSMKMSGEYMHHVCINDPAYRDSWQRKWHMHMKHMEICWFYAWEREKKNSSLHGFEFIPMYMARCIFCLARLFVHLSPSHLVDDGSKVGRAVQLNGPQALEVRLEHAFDAHTVWVVRAWVLRETEPRALDKRSRKIRFDIFEEGTFL